MFKGWRTCVVTALLCVFLGGCLNLERAAQRAGRGAVLGATEPHARDSLQILTEQLGRSLNRQAMALRDSLLGASSQASLRALVDSLAWTLARSAVLGATSRQARDSLEALSNRLGRVLDLQAASVRESLVGASTQASLAALGDQLGRSLGRQLLATRDSLVGPATTAALTVMLDSLTAGLARNYQRSLQPLVHAGIDSLSQRGRAELGFIKRNAERLIITAGVVILVVIVIAGYVLMRYRKSRKTLELVTHQIDKIPDQQAYDELTARIRDRALEAQLEPYLKKVLDEQGL